MVPCCGVGGRDGVISIWVPYQSQPILVLEDVFENSVQDIAWNKLGSCMMAVSLDGSAVYLQVSIMNVVIY